jgi:hypothetical protein
MNLICVNCALSKYLGGVRTKTFRARTILGEKTVLHDLNDSVMPLFSSGHLCPAASPRPRDATPPDQRPPILLPWALRRRPMRSTWIAVKHRGFGREGAARPPERHPAALIACSSVLIVSLYPRPADGHLRDGRSEICGRDLIIPLPCSPPRCSRYQAGSTLMMSRLMNL